MGKHNNTILVIKDKRQWIQYWWEAKYKFFHYRYRRGIHYNTSRQYVETMSIYYKEYISQFYEE